MLFRSKTSEPENGEESEQGLSTEDSCTPEDKGKTPTGVTTGASVAVEGERSEDKEAKDKEEKEKKLGEGEEETPQPKLKEKKKNEGGNARDQRKEAKDDSKKKAANIGGSISNEGKVNRKVSEGAQSKSSIPQGQQGKRANAKPGKPKGKQTGAGASPGNVAGRTAEKSVRNPASAGKGDQKKKKEGEKNQKPRTSRATESCRQDTRL